MQIRAQLEVWRNEIANEIELAKAELAASTAALEAAQAAEVSEKTRAHDLIAAFGRIGKDAVLSSALRHRFEDGRRFCSSAATHRHVQAVATAQSKIADLRSAIDQIGVMLLEPAPRALALVDTRQPIAGAATYDPFVPARVA